MVLDREEGCLALLLCPGGQISSILLINLEVNGCLLKGLASSLRLLWCWESDCWQTLPWKKKEDGILVLFPVAVETA